MIKDYIIPRATYNIYFEPPELHYQFCDIVRKQLNWPNYKFIYTKNKVSDVSIEEIPQDIQNYHEDKTNHREINKTETRIKYRYYWPSMRNSIETYINTCNICQRTKYERTTLNVKISVNTTPSKPFEIVHVDTIKIQKQLFLSIIDSFSKYVQIYSLQSLNAVDMVSNLLQFFSYLGIPKTIIADNGTELYRQRVIRIAQNPNTLYDPRKP